MSKITVNARNMRNISIINRNIRKITINPKKMDKSTIKLEAYKLLQARQISEDRILVERTNIYLLTNSFLFLGFATLACCIKKYPCLDCLECLIITIPVLGIILGVFLMIHNFASCRSLHNWHVSQEIVEQMPNNFSEDDVFRFMVNKDIAPEVKGHQVTYGDYKWVKDKEKGCFLVRLIKKLKTCMSKEDSNEENTSSKEDSNKENTSSTGKYSLKPRKGPITCLVILAEFIRAQLFQWLLPFIIFALWGVALKVAICLIQ